VASWEAYACGSRRAGVIGSQGLAAAVFRDGPERAILNNALLERDLTAADRASAVAAMEAAYASAGVTRFAAWVHETDQAMREHLGAREYTLVWAGHSSSAARIRSPSSSSPIAAASAGRSRMVPLLATNSGWREVNPASWCQP
jgi:hypothetical protein